MSDYLTEEEQIELFKKWVKQYGPGILLGVLIAIIILSGINFWHQHQIKHADRASAIYEEMLVMRSQNDPTATLSQANKLFNRYAHTAYSQMAAFMLARDAIIKKNYAQAASYLRWVLAHSSVASFRQVARIRLARLLLSEQKPAESLQILEKVDDVYFKGLIDEVRGDAYLAMKKAALARESYRQALLHLPNAEIVRPLLQMKYDNLAFVKNAAPREGVGSSSKQSQLPSNT